MQYFLTSYINDKLTEAITSASNVLHISLPGDQLYEELVPNDVKRATAELSGLIQPITFYKFDLINGIGMNIHLEPTHKYPCFFTPAHGFRVLPESKIKSQFDLLAQTAVEWANLRFVVSQFSQLPSRAFSMLMPWAKELAMDHPGYNSKSDWSQDKAIKRGLEGLVVGRASTFPALTPSINNICKSGGKLFTQYKLSKDAKPVRTHDNYISIIPDNVSVSERVQDEMATIMDNYRERLLLRKSKRDDED